MKKQTFMFACLLVAVVVGLASVCDSAIAGDRSGRPPQTGGMLKPTGTPASTLININNLAGWIRNDGWSARVPSSGNSGVYFPRGTSTCIFQDGIVWGGNVNDGGSQILRVGGQTYSIGTIGGRIVSAGVADDPNAPAVRIYRVRRDYKTADLKQDAAEFFEKGLSSVTSGDIATVRAQYETDWNEWPAKGNPNNPSNQNAPFYDKDGDGLYNPTVDEPGIADADQVVFFVCNDLNPGRTNALYGSNPIGLELQVTLWGYNRTDPLGNVFFKKFTFIYKGTSTSQANSRITDMYVGQWSDPDMGDAGDDFAGCDTTKSLVYVYNGRPIDSEYAKFGLKPPAVGYDFLQGPIVPSPGDSAVFGLKRRYGVRNLPMTAAFYFAAGSTISDPPFTREGTIQWYNLLRGLLPISGAPFIHPSVPGATTFWLDGDPVTHTGRLDGVISQPGDRRIGACSGPFTMALGDTQEVVVGVVAGIAGDYLSSISVMKNNDVAVQRAYDDLFDLPKAPPAPNVKTVALDKQIVLDWGSDLTAVQETETFNKKGYQFEGYNVYQLPSASSGFDQAIRLATFDLLQPQDELIFGQAVRTIVDTVFDVGLGTGIIKVVQRGIDSGIKRELVIDQDKVRTAPLVNGQQYYFAVTAYGFNPSSDALTHALESSMRILTVVPKTPDPGVRLSASYGQELVVTNTNPGKKSDGIVVAKVVDPTKVTGLHYKVTFKDTVTHFPSGDEVFTNWTLEQGGSRLFRSVNQGPTAFIDPDGNLGNEFDYPIIDGMFVTVSGPAPLLNETRTGWTGTRWWTGSGRFSLGGPGSDKLRNQVTTAADAHNYLGAVAPTTNPPDYVDIEFRFGAGGSLTQKAYQYFRQGSPNEYRYQGYRDVPFQVWDVSDPANPRQLNCGWRDQNQNGLYDVGAGSANTEIIFVAKSTYDGNTPTTYGTTVGSFANNIPRGDFMYLAEWISATGLTSNITATTIHVSPNYVNSSADVFEFDAPAAPTFSQSAAKSDVSQINVFPNPYYGFNRAETSRQSRFVMFNHLPARAEIRIFNLAGALVAAYDETAAPPRQRNGQYQPWDLKNQNGLPVASGIYIVHINMPDLGTTKVLKLIVVQEQQFLDNF